MKRITFALAAIVVLAGCGDDNNKPKYNYAVLDFENAPIVAGPTAKGENLYAADAQFGYAYGPEVAGYDAKYPNYASFTDPNTGLTVGIKDDSGINFWNGGIAPSRWHDMEDGTLDNQCSTYYIPSSPTFGIVHSTASMSFAEGVERTIESMMVANSTYAALVMKNGDSGGFASALTYENKGWLLLTAEGFDAEGESTGTAEYYLADFRTASSTGIASGWKLVPLGGLGAVNRVEFSFTGSDSGTYGLNTPAYACVDDVIVRL
jgi:hypothetical protein